MPAKKHSKGTSAQPKSSVVEKRLSQQLEEIDRRTSSGEWRSAHAMLVEMYRRFPDNPHVLSRLLDTSYQTGDTERYQESCEKLLQLLPDDAELTLALAGAYILNARPALARKTFQAYSQKWPDHAASADVEKSLQEIDQYLSQVAAENKLDFQQAAQLMELHERMQSLHHQGRYRQAVQVGEELLQAFPAYVPVYNNLSQLHWQLDHREKALQLVTQALHIESGNLLALANLAIYQLLSGQVEHARSAAAGLKLAEDSPLVYIQRVIEAHSYLGDDLQVLQAFELVRAREDFQLAGAPAASVYHLVGVAYLRQGSEQQAAESWDLALQANPGNFNARLNRQDLEKPAHLRQAPWSHTITQWLSEKTVRESLSIIDPSQRSIEAATLKQKVQRYVNKHPELVQLAPFMLDSGDESARDFILLLASHAGEARLLTALEAFAAGRRGPDQLRLEAAHILVRSGSLVPGMRKMWINGQHMDILLADIQVVEGSRPKHSEQVNILFSEALQFLSAGDALPAVSLLESAHSLEPGAADILYNLAVALQLQGQVERSHVLVEQVHRENPDYFFGRTGMAQLLFQKGDYPAAREMLAPLFRLRSMSPAELDAFCALNVDLQLAAQNLPAARAWFGYWESANPENHRLEAYRRKVEGEPPPG